MLTKLIRPSQEEAFLDMVCDGLLSKLKPVIAAPAAKPIADQVQQLKTALAAKDVTIRDLMAKLASRDATIARQASRLRQQLAEDAREDAIKRAQNECGSRNLATVALGIKFAPGSEPPVRR